MGMYIIKCKNGNEARHLWAVLHKLQKEEAKIETISNARASDVVVWLKEGI